MALKEAAAACAWRIMYTPEIPWSWVVPSGNATITAAVYFFYSL